MAAVMVPNPVCKAVLSTSIRVSVRTYGHGGAPNPFSSRNRVKEFKEIPGPFSLPVVGNIWKYYVGKYPLESMPTIYQGYRKTYGNLVKERLFFGRTLVHVFDPLDMNKIYQLDKSSLPHRVSHRALDEYRQSRPEMYKNGGLASINGEKWDSLRKSLGEDLLNERSNEAFEMVTDDLVSRINSRLSLNNDVSLLPMLYDWTLECMGVVALGQRLGCFSESPDERLAQFVNCIHFSQKSVFYTENLPWIFTRKHARQLAECQNFIYSFMWPLVDKVVTKVYTPEELADNDSPVALHKSVAYALWQKELDERDVRTLILDMFQGGIHSTAHILAFALYHLAKNPDIQKDVRASLLETFPSAGDKISSKPLNQKIKNVIRETMRLNPPTIGTGRVLPDSLVLSKHKVPAGTMCILHHQIASMQGQYFDNPEMFIPQRFTDEKLTKAAIVANQPFAMGKRACPGQHVALNELAIGLSKILRLFEVSYKHGVVGTTNYLINAPDKEIKITFTPINH